MAKEDWVEIDKVLAAGDDPPDWWGGTDRGWAELRGRVAARDARDRARSGQRARPGDRRGWFDSDWESDPPVPSDWNGTSDQWRDRVAHEKRVLAQGNARGRQLTEVRSQGARTPNVVERAEALLAEKEPRAELDRKSETEAEEWLAGILRESDKADELEARATVRQTARRFGFNPDAGADPVMLPRVKGGAEPTTYGPGSSHSYFRDFAAVRLAGLRMSPPTRDPNLSLDATVRRLCRNDEEWSYAARHGSDEERGLIRKYYSDRYRRQHGTASDMSGRDFREMLFDLERRDVSTSDASMGDFAPNLYLLKQWQLYRTAAASFASQGSQRPLPATGMVVEVPTMTGAMTMSVQASENQAIAAPSPTVSYATANVLTIAGGTKVSQQFVDRIGPGVESDEIIAASAARQAATTLDVQALTAVIGATSNTITNSGSSSVSALWEDVAKAAALIVDTEGTRLPITTVHMPGINSKWFGAQVDSEGRPIWLPSPAGSAALPGDVDSAEEGFTGYTLLGARVFENENMPETSGDATVLVGNPGIGLLVYSGIPIIDVFPETAPAQLSVQINVRQYIALSVVYANAFAVVSGAAYPVTPTFSGA